MFSFDSNELVAPGYLANGLQNYDASSKVADVEDGKLEVNVTVVTNARGQLLTTRLTAFVFLTCSLLKSSKVKIKPTGHHKDQETQLNAQVCGQERRWERACEMRLACTSCGSVSGWSPVW